VSRILKHHFLENIKTGFYMSLFGDLPSAKNDATSGVLVSTFSKKALIPPPSILRNKKKTLEASDTPGNAGFGSGGDANAPAASHGLFRAFGTIQDEYDPAVPNEYMKAKEDQEKAVLEADMEARRAAELRESVCCYSNLWLDRVPDVCLVSPPQSSEILSGYLKIVVELHEAHQRSSTSQAKEAEAEEAAAAADQEIPSTGGLGSSTAPGNSVQGSGVQMSCQRSNNAPCCCFVQMFPCLNPSLLTLPYPMCMSAPQFLPTSYALSSGGGTLGAGSVSKAMRMMKGMGWSEGEGLGKERQGMATPIILQKTDKRTGVIVNAEPLNKPPPPQVHSPAHPRATA
jgi:hypothetical protein